MKGTICTVFGGYVSVIERGRTINISSFKLILAASVLTALAACGGGGGAPSLAASGGTPSDPVIQTPETNAAAAPIGDVRSLRVDIVVDGTGQLDRDQAAEIARSLKEYIDDGGEAIAV